MLSLVILMNLFLVIPVHETFAASENQWEEIGPNAGEFTHVFVVENQYIGVRKNDKKSTVYVGNGTSWQVMLDNVNEIEAAFRTESGDVYLVGSKNGTSFYKSTDGGQSWSNLSGKFPSGISGSNKVEGIYVDDDEIYFAVEKKGLYYSDNGGTTWQIKNGNLPPEPGKTDYDVRAIWEYNDSLYAGTKKQAVYEAVYEENWVSLKGGDGLSGDGKEVFDAVFMGDDMFIGTKNGVYQTKLSDSAQGWSKIAGLNDEVKDLFQVADRIYAMAKNAKNLYYYDSEQEKLVAFTKPSSGVTIDELRYIDYDEPHFIVAHKKGILKVLNPFSDEENEETEGVVNKGAITSLINTIQSKYNVAVEGSGAGQYRPGSKALLLAAIDAAADVRDNATTQEEIDQAIIGLNSALAQFEASLNPDAWQEIGPDQMDGSHVFAIGNKYLLIRKKDEKSTVSLRNLEGIWADKFVNIPEIDAAYRSSNEVHMISSKIGQAFYKSSDGGESWVDLLQNGRTLPLGVSGSKIEALHVENQNIYLVVEKKGLYYSADGGETWQSRNGNLPPEPGKSDYDARALWKYDGKLYVATKKQGLYESADGLNWSTLKNNQGLTTEKAREVFDVSFQSNIVYIGTKDGVYQTDLSDQTQGWSKISGLNDEVKNMKKVSGRIYATAKEGKNLYYYDSFGTFRPFNNKPSGLSVEELKYMDHDGQYFVVAHKKGLLKIADGYMELTATGIADTITNIQAPYMNATTLVLPTVPQGFTLTIDSSSNPEVINLNGTIAPPEAETVVTLVLKVINTHDGTKALTQPIQVVVPKKGVGGDQDGIYEGIGNGRNGVIRVEVIISGNQIVSIKLLEHSESIERSDVANVLTLIPQKIINEQKVEVDTVTGATLTSAGIIKAVANALRETSFVSVPGDEWQDLTPDGQEGTLVFAVKGKYLYVSKDKDSKKSTIRLRSENGNFEVKLQNVNEIESGYRVPGTDSIYLIGRKEGAIFTVSHDGGETWSNPIEPYGIGAEKVESLLVLSENEMYICVGKYGLYRSIDGGSNWMLFNNDLPKNPEKDSEYDVRKIYTINGSWYIGTKKQGLLTSADSISWIPYKKDGLSSEGKDVWDIYKDGNTLYMTGKNGMWTTNVNDTSGWTQVPGFSGEGRKIMAVGERIYLAAKNLVMYYLQGGVLKAMGNKPTAISGEDPKSMDYADGYFVAAHKYGLVKIKDLLQVDTPPDGTSGATPSDDGDETDGTSGATPSDDRDETDGTSGATPSGRNTGGTGETDNKGAGKITLTEKDIVKDSSGKAVVTLTQDHIRKAFEGNSNNAVIEVVISGDFPEIELKIDRAAYQEMRNKEASLIITYPGGNYILPLQLAALDEMSKELGVLSDMTLIVKKVDATDAMIGDYQLLAQPWEYILKAQFEKGTTVISDFGKQFIERSIIIDSIIDFKKSNGVVFENGSWKPVPTIFRIEDGKTIATIKRNSNSIYSVVGYNKTFGDIKNHWSQEVVELLASKMILNGLGDAFEPEGFLTRAQFTTMLVKGLGLKLIEEPMNRFSDVVPGSWYENYVYTATSFGITSGYEDGTFRPEKLITREEMAVMATRAIELVKGLEKLEILPGVTQVKWTDGAYEGTATGAYGTPLRLKVQVKSGEIQKIDALEMNETPNIGSVGVEKTIEKIIHAQSTEVDVYTGATISSKAAMKAVSDALAKSKDTSKSEVKNNPAQYNPFIDESQMSSWTREAIQYASQTKLLNGYTDGSFRPKNTSKRAEAAVVIKNVLEALKFISF